MKSSVNYTTTLAKTLAVQPRFSSASTMSSRLLVLMLLLCSFQSHLFAANRYIRAGATGANNGTSWNDAWSTFSKAVWTRGDTYYVAGGTYNENVTVTKSLSGNALITIKKANAADNAGDAGWSTSYASTVALINGCLNIFNGYVVWDGVTGSDETGHGFKVYQATLAGNTAVVYFDPSGESYTFGHTEVRGSGFSAGSTGQDGIYYNCTAKKRFWVYNCYIHEVTRNGITTGGTLGTSYSDYGFLYENNFMSETGGCPNPDIHGQGMQISFGDREAYTIIRNSKFRNTCGTGTIVWLAGAGSNHSDARVYNNVFWNTNLAVYINQSPGVIYCHSNATSQARFFIANNTVYGWGSVAYPVSAHPQFIIDTVGATGNVLQNNLFEANHFTATHRGFDTQSNNAYYKNTGSGVPSGTERQINGLITTHNNALLGDFTLQASGYAVGNGTNLSNVFTNDIVGNPRSIPWDIGAYEFGAGGILAPNNAQIGITIQ